MSFQWKDTFIQIIYAYYSNQIIFNPSDYISLYHQQQITLGREITHKICQYRFKHFIKFWKKKPALHLVIYKEFTENSNQRHFKNKFKPSVVSFSFPLFIHKNQLVSRYILIYIFWKLKNILYDHHWKSIINEIYNFSNYNLCSLNNSNRITTKMKDKIFQNEYI